MQQRQKKKKVVSQTLQVGATTCVEEQKDKNNTTPLCNTKQQQYYVINQRKRTDVPLHDVTCKHVYRGLRAPGYKDNHLPSVQRPFIRLIDELTPPVASKDFRLLYRNVLVQRSWIVSRTVIHRCGVTTK